MTIDYDDLRAQMSPASRARSEARAAARLREMNLQEIRTVMSALSQGKVAEQLEVTQGYVSRMEHQKDMPVSRLYEYIATLGGRVEITAVFPRGDGEEEVRVTQFAEFNRIHAIVEGRSNSEAPPAPEHRASV